MVTRLDRRQIKPADEYIIIPNPSVTTQTDIPDLKKEWIRYMSTANMWEERIKMATIITLTQTELDSIIERSKKVGAILDRLDSINTKLGDWADGIDNRLKS